MSENERFDALTDSAIIGNDPTAPSDVTSIAPHDSAPPPATPAAEPPGVVTPPAAPPVAPDKPVSARLAPTPTAPSWPPTAASRRFRWLWIPGAFVMVAGAVALALGVWSLVATVGRVTDAPLVGDGRPLSVDLQRGDERTLWVEQGSATPTCRVIDPGGDVASPAEAVSVTVHRNGQEFTAVGGFTAVVTGVHVIDCRGGSARVSDGSVTGGIARGVAGILVGVAALVGGILLTVGALVGWGAINRRSRR